MLVTVDECYTKVCHMTQSKVVEVQKLRKWSISKCISACVHVIQIMSVICDNPRQYLNFLPDRFFIFVLVCHHAIFKVTRSRLAVMFGAYFRSFCFPSSAGRCLIVCILLNAVHLWFSNRDVDRSHGRATTAPAAWRLH